MKHARGTGWEEIVRGVLIVVGLCMVAFAVMADQQWQSEYESNMHAVQSASVVKTEVTEETAMSTPKPVSNDEVLMFIQDAQAKATAVAAQQDKMQEYIAAYSTDENKLADIQASMDALKVYSSEQAFYDWAWYSWSDEFTGISWSGFAAQDATGADVPVVWLCQNDAGDVLAYATAVYHGDTGMFTDFSKATTNVGMAYLPYETAETAQEDQSTEDFLSDVKDLLQDNDALPEQMGGDYDLGAQPLNPVPAGDGTGVGTDLSSDEEVS